MTSEQFNDFLSYMGWSVTEASKQLGLARGTIHKFKNEGTPLTKRNLVYLACAALKDGHRAQVSNYDV